MKRLIVLTLVRACTICDRITPDWRWRFPGHVCRLAEWSWRLDERWGVGHWQPPFPACPATVSNGRGTWFCEENKGHDGDHSFWRGGPARGQS